MGLRFYTTEKWKKSIQAVFATFVPHLLEIAK
jgi:hypothetical protein